jgi:hypothetical protein
VIKPTHNSVLARRNNMQSKGSGKLTGMLEKKLAERGMLLLFFEMGVKTGGD